MATTISDARDQVKSRALVGTSSAEATNAEIEDYLRDAFRWLVAAVPLIRRTTATVADGEIVLPAEIEDVEIIYAGLRSKMLFASEWGQEGETIHVLNSSVADGDPLTLYYAQAPEIADDASEVDTDSIFGKNWLEPIAITMAALNVYHKGSNRSASRGGDKAVSMMRMMQEERERLIAPYLQRVERWYQMMESRKNERRESGDIPVVNRRKGLINGSKIINPLIEA